MFKHFLIPTDGSPATKKPPKPVSCSHAGSVQKSLLMPYCALEELQPIYAEGYAFRQKDYDGFDVRAREIGQKRVDAIGKMAKAAGVPFTSVVAKALTPYEGIVAVAKKRKCGAIFMASHGRRGLSRLVMSKCHAESADALQDTGGGVPR
ncbi:MAG: universal stress protein [Rugosibacter sp.]|nr:MAG: universal stress protein [Rugosibacter sp.]